MGNRISDIGKIRNNIDAQNRVKIFTGKKTARLGTERNPAVVHVQTEERLREVTSTFEEHGWQYTIELKRDEPEDITDLARLLNPSRPAIAAKKVGRNELCSCGSGKKHKNCCGK